MRNRFLEQARIEANRYGPDPWIFVRELLQNARDAGATRVEITVEQVQNSCRFSCEDDGEGMSFEDARRYLFALFSSSKESRGDQAGRFGVGFWSVLRLEPQRIEIRSRADGHPGWGVELDGGLETARHVSARRERGTSVVLERPGDAATDAAYTFDVAQQNARFIRMRDRPEDPLVVTVNGRSINAPFALSEPSESFERRFGRGVVGLGPKARVELFSRGLRVRSAVCLEDLASATEFSRSSRVRFPELSAGLVPQVLLESDEIELILSRSDARDDRAMRRVVETAQARLRHLIKREIEHARPPSGRENVRIALRKLWRAAFWLRPVLGVSVGLGLAMLANWRLGTNWFPATWAWQRTVIEQETEGASGEPSAPSEGGMRYRGPGGGTLRPERSPGLSYQATTPEAKPTRFVLFSSDDGRSWQHQPTVVAPGWSCERNCLKVDYELREPPGSIVPVPIPVHHHLDTGSLRFEGRGSLDSIRLNQLGHPVLVHEGELEGTLHYTTGYDPTLASEPSAAVTAAEDQVRSWVEYDSRKNVASRFEGHSVEELEHWANAHGSGDCEFVNDTLHELLTLEGHRARFVAGFTAREGGVYEVLHAWVMVHSGSGWYSVDASLGEVDQAEERASARHRELEGTPMPTAPPRDADMNWVLWLPIGAGGLAAALAMFLITRERRPRSSLNTNEKAERENHLDIGELVRGYLASTGAYGQFPEVAQRHLIPVLGRRPISIERARTLSAAGKLYAGGRRTALSSPRHVQGMTVLDNRTVEGRAVATAMGAIDLDHWGRLRQLSTQPHTLSLLSDYFIEQGERWQLFALRGLGSSVATLDLRPFAREELGELLVLINVEEPALVKAQSLSGQLPLTATFVLLDHLLECLDVDKRRRARLLAPLAARAIKECQNDV